MVLNVHEKKKGRLNIENLANFYPSNDTLNHGKLLRNSRTAVWTQSCCASHRPCRTWYTRRLIMARSTALVLAGTRQWNYYDANLILQQQPAVALVGSFVSTTWHSSQSLSHNSAICLAQRNDSHWQHTPLSQRSCSSHCTVALHLVVNFYYTF